MQQLLIDVSREQFSKLMRDTVLTPIGMTHSTYEQPLPEVLRAKSATPYMRNGMPREAFTPIQRWRPRPMDDSDGPRPLRD